MKKLFFYTIATFVLLTITSGNGYCQAVMTMTTETNFREFENKTIFEGDTLNGKIKTIIESIYGQIHHGGKHYNGENIIYTFDEYGLQIRRKGNEQDFLKYYSFNKLVKTEIYREKTGELDITFEYVYDENKNLYKYIRKSFPARNYNFDYHVTYYKYDKNNQLIEIEKGNKPKNSEETITETIKYQYDENGDCVIEEEYRENDLSKKKEHKYINHKLIETFSWQWFEETDLYIKNLYTYNNDGTLESNTRIFYHYGSKNEIAMENTTLYYYTYDNKNRLIEYQEINERNYKKITYSDFDEKGNWQQKNTDDNGRKSKVIRRFEYF